MSKKILITGAAGFLGSHFLEEVLVNTDWEIVALCRMTFVGDLQRIIDSCHVQENAHRVKLVFHDLKFELPPHTIEAIGDVDYVAHIAANSHVDRSIAHEVFGPAPQDYDFKEDDRWRPSNPYSASKAGQGALGIAYYNTYQLPIIHTYTMNLFGERQHKEKLIAKSIENILHNRVTKIHAKIDESGNVEYVGQRHWLHARNAANATLFLIKHGLPGEHYNVVGDTEMHNDKLVETIAKLMNITPNIEYVDFAKARPGHDRRYSLDGSKLSNMGWKPPLDFLSSLEKTIKWMISESK